MKRTINQEMAFPALSELDRRDLVFMTIIAVFVVIFDMVGDKWQVIPMFLPRFLEWHGVWRLYPCFLFIFLIWDRFKVPPTQYGFRYRFDQNLFYWFKIILFIGFLVLTFGVLFIIVAKIFGFWSPAHYPPLPNLWSLIISFCIEAPLLEETIYRGILCPPINSLLGSRWAILISGSSFGLVHFIYGNPGPDNFIAGYFLAWAFIKSRSIVIPIAMHSLGNLVVILVQILVYYYPNLINWLM